MSYSLISNHYYVYTHSIYYAGSKLSKFLSSLLFSAKSKITSEIFCVLIIHISMQLIYCYNPGSRPGFGCIFCEYIIQGWTVALCTGSLQEVHFV